MNEPANPAPASNLDRLAAILDEVRRQHNPKRSAAEQAEYAALAANYPGQFVAFLDAWDGAVLTRRVVAASASLAEFHRQLRAYPDYEARRTEIQATQIRDPEDDTILVPALFTVEEEEAPDGAADVQGADRE